MKKTMIKQGMQRVMAGILALAMVLSILPAMSVMAATGSWGKLNLNGTYVNINADGNAEVQRSGSNRRFYMESKGENKITLKLENGKYLGISDEIKDGTRVKAVDSPYIWEFKDGALRPPTNTKMIVNASGEKFADGTHIILWTGPDGYVPKHANFTFEKERSVIFNANGGKGTMKKAVITEDYVLPKNKFKRDGYKFIGWSTKKTATEETFYPVGDYAAYIGKENKDVTLYAQWVKPKTYKITYSTKDIKLPAKAIKKYTSGKTTQLPIPEITKKSKSEVGNTFAGWSITVNGKKIGTYYEIPPYLTGDLKLTPIIAELEG